MHRCKILNFKNNTWFNICIKNQNTDTNYYFLVPVCMGCDRRWYIVTHLKTSNSLPYHRPGLANLWHACPKWHAAFATVPLFFIYSARPGSLSCDEYVYVCMYSYLTGQRLYMNYRCYQIILRAKHFCTNQERCEVLTGYLSLGCRPGGDWTNM